MSTAEVTTVAVFGLGQMGSGMAATQARAGRAVLGVDPGSNVGIEGVTQVGMDEALKGSDVLLLSLPGSPQVQQVLTGPDGLLARDLAPRLVIDTSTSDPAVTRELATKLVEQGHVLVDAPVSGGPAGAREGALTVFLGSPEDHLGRVHDVIGPMTAQVTHVGDVGAGNVAKLVNNLLCGIHLTAVREAWALAQAAGIDPERLLTAINRASGRSAVTEINLPRWALTGNYDSGFPVGLMARDIALASDVAHHLGIANPLSSSAVLQWQRLLQDTGPDADFNRMIDL